MLIALMLVAIVGIFFVLSEVNIYREGGEVYEWTVKFSKWLKQYNL